MEFSWDDCDEFECKWTTEMESHPSGWARWVLFDVSLFLENDLSPGSN